MKVKVIHDKRQAFELLKNRTRYDYPYQFNNLEEKEWDKVVCYGLFDDSKLLEIAMLIVNYDPPVLLAASFENEEYNTELIRRIKKLLPSKFYTHMNRTTLENIFQKDVISDIHEYMNMGLDNNSVLEDSVHSEVVRLGINDLPAVKELMSVSYPDCWLDDELVKLNENFGIFVDGKLVSFAGIHAYSEEYQIAAVAHVTTHPGLRNRGYGKKVVAALSKSLRNKIANVGLNVKTDNAPAINCYKKLGYKEYGTFIACDVEIKP